MRGFVFFGRRDCPYSTSVLVVCIWPFPPVSTRVDRVRWDVRGRIRLQDRASDTTVGILWDSFLPVESRGSRGIPVGSGAPNRADRTGRNIRREIRTRVDPTTVPTTSRPRRPWRSRPDVSDDASPTSERPNDHCTSWESILGRRVFYTHASALILNFVCCVFAWVSGKERKNTVRWVLSARGVDGNRVTMGCWFRCQ